MWRSKQQAQVVFRSIQVHLIKHLPIQPVSNKPHAIVRSRKQVQTRAPGWDDQTQIQISSKWSTHKRRQPIDVNMIATCKLTFFQIWFRFSLKEVESFGPSACTSVNLSVSPSGILYVGPSIGLSVSLTLLNPKYENNENVAAEEGSRGPRGMQIVAFEFYEIRGQSRKSESWAVHLLICWLFLLFYSNNMHRW